jgi:uncharacterized protein
VNQLQYESSPYLLQHAYNPVHWYAWKPAAFAAAIALDKPILVSIGYSTCHWCHVMERESFENEQVAAYMNEHFVCIKVDREERPDVDHIYMEACQILTGSGGWPLNCFLTPQGKPFYAGTYFPPRPAHQRPSWMQLMQHLSNIWQNKREVAEEQAEKLLKNIELNDNVFIYKKENKVVSEELSMPIKQIFTPTLMENILYKMRDNFDRVEGGFGGAPKFPGTMGLRFLLHYHHFSTETMSEHLTFKDPIPKGHSRMAGSEEALEHALFSLDKMIMGGIYDQLGGGFARYATDRAWLVPHFEKMLYDNALLVTVIADAYKLLKNNPKLHPERLSLYHDTLVETLNYIEREMTHPEGGFYSAQDADSEGVEGKFFVWSKADITELLGEKAMLFCDFYDVTEEGNWEESNILWRKIGFEDFAKKHNIEVETLKKELKSARKILFDARDQRIYPGLDDKILLSWNALMVTAYVQTYTAIGDITYKNAAVRNLEFCLEKFKSTNAQTLETKQVNADSTLSHTYKNGVAQYDAFLEDYAFLIQALIETYQISFNLSYLELAGKYTAHVLSYFYDESSGLFFFTGKDQKDIIIRRKDLYDNATPSGNSTMALNLQQLGILLNKPDWLEIANRMLLAVKESVERYPLSFERWAMAMLYKTYPMLEIVIVGDNAENKAMSIVRQFVPNKVIIASIVQTDVLSLFEGKESNPDAYIYVCQDFACQRPILVWEQNQIYHE